MNKFSTSLSIILVNYSNGGHLDELISALTDELSKYTNVINSASPVENQLNIILGLNVALLRGKPIHLPRESIIFNLEQLEHNWAWQITPYLNYLLRFPVIDYSASNVAYLTQLGNKNSIYCPIRFHRSFVWPVRERKKDIDVLLLGVSSPRRNSFIAQLQKDGLNAYLASECWGEYRNELLSRTKLCVNVRAQEIGLLETTRLTSLISSGIPVISENSAERNEDEYFSCFVPLVPFKNLSAQLKKHILENKWKYFYSEEQIQQFSRDNFATSINTVIPFVLKIIEFFKVTSQPVAAERCQASKYLQDYAAGLCNADYEIDEFIRTPDKLTRISLTLALQIFQRKSLPNLSRKILAQYIALNFARAKPKKLDFRDQFYYAKFLADTGDIEGYLWHVCKCVNWSLLYKHSKPDPNAAAFSAFDVFLRLENLKFDCAFSFMLADLLWDSEQSLAAARLYRRKKTAFKEFLPTELLETVALRLFKFGYYADARYFSASVAADQVGTEVRNAVYDLISTNPDSLCLKQAQVLDALTRSYSVVKRNVRINSQNNFVVGDEPLACKIPILNSRPRVFDGKFEQINALKTQASVVAVLAVFNEADIIETTIRHYIDQGVLVYVIDNWSTDGTWELLNIIKLTFSSLRIERWPSDCPSNEYDWNGLLKRKQVIAREFVGYWILHVDADEIRQSPWESVSLPLALGFVELYGFNAVDFSVLNFKPVDDGFRAGMNFVNYFKFFELANTSDLRYQIKCWKQGTEEVNLQEYGGHFVGFLGKRVFPFKFVCRHYPIRSTRHAEKKILRDRMNRFNESERAKGWHSHYDGYDITKTIIDWKSLFYFTSVEEPIVQNSLIYGFE